jgi:hypothetical protein
MTIQNTIQNWCDAPEIHPSQIRVGDIIGTLRPTEKRFRVKMIGPPQASPGRWTFFGSDVHGQQHEGTFGDDQLVRRYAKAS